MMRSDNQKGQSTVEYILLVTAVIGVVVLFMTGNNNKFQQRLTNTLDISTNSMANVATRLIP